jgi:hypothetical protein
MWTKKDLSSKFLIRTIISLDKITCVCYVLHRSKEYHSCSELWKICTIKYSKSKSHTFYLLYDVGKLTFQCHRFFIKRRMIVIPHRVVMIESFHGWWIELTSLQLISTKYSPTTMIQSPYFCGEICSVSLNLLHKNYLSIYLSPIYLSISICLPSICRNKSFRGHAMNTHDN